MGFKDIMRSVFGKKTKLLGDGSETEKGEKSKRDLSPEDFKIMFANELGIDSVTLNLPGVKKAILSLKIFDGIVDKKSYKEAIKKINENVEIENGKEGDVSHLVIGAKVKGVPGDKVRIEKVEGLTKIFLTDAQRYAEECRCYNSNGLEVRRYLKDLYDKGYTDMFERDKNNIRIVRHVDNISKTGYDIAWNDADIATLDDVENGEMIMLSTRLGDVGLSNHNKEDNYKRITEKIKNSERSDIFYEHYGYKPQDNSMAQENSKTQDNFQSQDTQPITQQRDEYRKSLRKLAENLTPEQYKIKLANEMGVDFSVLNLPGAKEFIFASELFSKIEDEESYEKAKADGTKVIIENGKIDIGEEISITKEGGNTRIVKYKREREKKSMVYEDRAYNEHGLEIKRKIGRKNRLYDS